MRCRDLGSYNPNIFQTEFITSNYNFSYYHGDPPPDVNNSVSLQMSTLCEMDANDTCQVRLSLSGGASGGTDDGVDVDGDTGTGQSTFSGFLVG